MKRTLVSILSAILLTTVLAISLIGCESKERVPKETSLPVLAQSLKSLENTHAIEDFKFIAKYDTGAYKLDRWRVTDSKLVNINATIQDAPKGATILIEHVHIDMSLKSTDAQLDGLSQDSMDDTYHGTSQDGFLVTEKYPYQNTFAIEGFSKDIIEGWGYYCGEFGTAKIDSKRLTETNLVEEGEVYANKMQVVYDLLIKYEGEKYYHTVSIVDEFLIPLSTKSSKVKEEEQQ